MKKSFVILALLLAFSMLFSACTEGTVEVSTVHSDFVCVFVINQVNEVWGRGFSMSKQYHA